MLAGLEDISAGDILIDGRVVNEIEPRDRDIAMVFQDYALYPHMSVYENMAFSLRYRGVAKRDIDARVRDAAAVLGLEPYLKRRPK
ncbi:ATP-binding cassette domain-containing protein, partial [Stenotrophomonas maltophilia]|uniref:ATP-binding cassette domain-containing protein n=1 Tax=Stenotrophomonas maltophilia TaxID=40324 RepID=UPI0013D965CE